MRAPIVLGIALLAVCLTAAGFMLVGDGVAGLFSSGNGRENGASARAGAAGNGLAPVDLGGSDAGAPGSAGGPKETGEGGETVIEDAAVPPVLLLRGRVIARDGPPPADAQVVVKAANGKLVNEDVTGGAEFRVMGPPGEIRRVVVTAPTYVARTFEDIPEGARLTVILEPGIAFTGRVFTIGGKAVDLAEISIVPRGRRDAVTLTTKADEEGRFRIESAAPGRYDVSVIKEDLAPYHDIDLVLPPAGLEKDYMLHPGFTLTGEVISLDGKLS